MGVFMVQEVQGGAVRQNAVAAAGAEQGAHIGHQANTQFSYI
jgi:hypothetical protein